MAMKIGKPVFKAMAAAKPDYISSDCSSPAATSSRDRGRSHAAKLAHPLTLIRMAYGL